MTFKEFLNVYSPFDYVKPNLCKVGFGCIIEQNGNILLSHPSHEKVLIEYYGFNKIDILRQMKCANVENLRDYLTNVTKAILVYENGYIGALNKQQMQILKRLKMRGIYKGTIYEIDEKSPYSNLSLKREKIVLNKTT